MCTANASLVVGQSSECWLLAPLVHKESIGSYIASLLSVADSFLPGRKIDSPQRAKPTAEGHKVQRAAHGEAQSNQTPVAVPYENDARVRGFGK